MARELEPWKIRARQTVYSAPPWLTVEQQAVELPDGRLITDYQHLIAPDSVLVATQTKSQLWLFTRQYKHGARQVTLALPGGTLEPDEPPLVTAQRELLEETGYIAEEWHKLGAFAIHGNYGCGFVHLYLATRAEQTATPLANDLEEMELQLLTTQQSRVALHQGDIAVFGAAATMALALLALANDG